MKKHIPYQTMMALKKITSFGLLTSIFFLPTWAENPHNSSTPAEALSYSVAAGYEHTLVLSGGKVWAWGDNNANQLGNGTTKNWAVPSQVIGLEDIIALAKGSTANHSVALRNDGTVWSWGNNKNGELGHGDNINLSIPKKVDNLPFITAIATGQMHTLAIDDAGRVWTWGTNYGGMGHQVRVSANEPFKLIHLSNVREVAAGNFHSLALCADGTVWGWGRNNMGQLGIENMDASKLPIQLESLNDVVQISAGGSHSAALKSDGTVWAWGWNEYGQIGNAATTSITHPVKVPIENVVMIAAGGVHTLALKSDGTVWAWGCNLFGQLGVASNSNHLNPVKIANLEQVAAIAAGDLHSVAVKYDGTVLAWGQNQKGQLGNNTQANANFPVEVFKIAMHDEVHLTTTSNILPNTPTTSILFEDNTSAPPTPASPGDAVASSEWTMKGAADHAAHKKTTSQPDYYKVPNGIQPLVQTKTGFFEVENTPISEADCPIVKGLHQVNLEAHCQPNTFQIDLGWTMDASAENIDFTIERSTDNHTWVEVTPVQYVTERNGVLFFEASEEYAGFPKSYYRLKQLSCSGDYAFSAPTTLVCPTH